MKFKNSISMKYFSRFIKLLIIVLLFSVQSEAQIQSSSLSFNRGKLWQSVFNGKIAPSFNNWRRVGIGLDWPGFDPSWVNQNLGGAPSYMLSGGIIVGCKKTNDSVLVVEDWAIAGSTISTEPSAKYKIIKHAKIFGDNGNFWLQTDPNKGEEVIETIWEYNINYTDSVGIKMQMPIRVRRTAHQWSGNKREENYVLYEYVIKNISNEIKQQLAAIGDTLRIKSVPDTLKDFYSMFTYAMHANSRSWTVLFPTETPGAKNTWYFWDPSRKMIWGRASDYLNTAIIERDFGFANSQGKLLEKGLGGEFLAPGYVGLRLLYSSLNKNNVQNAVVGYGWSAADNSFDFAGPLTNKNTEITQYEVLKDPSFASNFVKTSTDTVYMKRSRMWSMMSIGPWDLNPGDSVRFAVAEIVDGVDYALAVDSSKGSVIGSEGGKIFLSTSDKALRTFENNFNHPDPPAAPNFTVDYYKEREKFVANQITWSDEMDNYTDPDDGVADLVGYKVYRSSHLPIGPWDSVGVVYKQDPKNYSNGNYTFVDSTVQIGTSYYYSLTAFDTGRASWNINTSQIFEETRSNRVPPLESSIYANKKITRFTATLPASKNVNDIVVVPNPFVIGKGRSQPGENDRIQFINLPNPCTIRIYTLRGDLVKTINVNEGDGAIASWDQITDYGQYVSSGVYIYNVESASDNKTGKFSIIR
ncbi:MAG: hypothetical protein ACM3O3_00170, partial [Syntrophothermus sp.]